MIYKLFGKGYNPRENSPVEKKQPERKQRHVLSMGMTRGRETITSGRRNRGELMQVYGSITSLAVLSIVMRKSGIAFLEFKKEVGEYGSVWIHLWEIEKEEKEERGRGRAKRKSKIRVRKRRRLGRRLRRRSGKNLLLGWCWWCPFQE